MILTCYCDDSSYYIIIPAKKLKHPKDTSLPEFLMSKAFIKRPIPPKKSKQIRYSKPKFKKK